MKRAILLALLVSGCVTQEQRDMASAEEMCRQSAAANAKSRYSHADCVADNYHNLRILSSYTPPAPQPSSGSAYYPSQTAAIPPTDAPPLQNILPPTARCQSVSAGLGTVQTICR